MSDFNAKVHQIRFWLRLRRKNLQRSLAPSWCGGDWLPLPWLHLHSTKCREAAKYVLIRLHCTSKMHIPSFIGGVRATGTLCFYSDAQPL